MKKGEANLASSFFVIILFSLSFLRRQESIDENQSDVIRFLPSQEWFRVLDGIKFIKIKEPYNFNGV
ncbi:hypothetical protein OAD28_08580 [Flavobacteriales bacterium]|jgi:hypothetical protein|nr:hypothetical protein [Flavobacteriales bacterium]